MVKEGEDVWMLEEDVAAVAGGEGGRGEKLSKLPFSLKKMWLFFLIALKSNVEV